MTVRSLRHLLSLQAFLIAVIPFALAGILGSFWLKPQIDREIEERQVQLGRAVAAQVDSYMVAPLANIQGLAALVDSGHFALDELQLILDAHVSVSPFLPAIYLADQQGTIHAVGLNNGSGNRRDDLVGLDFSRNHLFRRALREGRAVWSDTFLSVVGGGLSVGVAVPTSAWVAIGEIDLGRLTDYLRTVAMEPGKLILVLDERGQVIADQEGSYTAQQLNISNIPLVRSGLDALSAVSGRFDFAGRTLVGSVTPISSHDWHVLVAVPVDIAYQTIWTSLRIVVVGSVGAIGFALLLALFLGRGLAAPFEELTVHARRIAQGGQGAWPTAQIAEFNELAGDLQQMSDTLADRERQLAAALVEAEQARERQQELDRLKSEFISTAAHELRTPLTVIMGFAELLAGNTGLTAEQREYLATIIDKSEVLQRLIDDLLDLGRVERGKLVHVEKGPCELREIVERVVADFRLTCPDHQFDVELVALPLPLHADRMRLMQVLENLLGNAVKFSPSGSCIEIVGGLSERGVTVAVRDQGVGMTAEQAERMFDKFYRADSSTTAKQGLGLGMTIVKNIVEAHQGRITVDSAPGEGTEIRLELPLGGSQAGRA